MELMSIHFSKRCRSSAGCYVLNMCFPEMLPGSGKWFPASSIAQRYPEGDAGGEVKFSWPEGEAFISASVKLITKGHKFL